MDTDLERMVAQVRLTVWICATMQVEAEADNDPAARYLRGMVGGAQNALRAVEDEARLIQGERDCRAAREAA